MLPEPEDTHDLFHRIADLARMLHNGVEESPEDVLQRIVEYAAETVPGAQYAGISLATSHHRVETPAASHPIPVLLDIIQETHQEGPCLSAAWHQHTVRIDNLDGDDRWPFYRREALNSTPIKSIMSFRLFVTEATMGALNVYSDRAHAFDDEAQEVGYVLATHAALAWDTVRRAAQFRSALASRDVIGQAKGILMARFNIDAVRAFELLKRISQDSNIRLLDVAEKLTASKRFDDI